MKSLIPVTAAITVNFIIVKLSIRSVFFENVYKTGFICNIREFRVTAYLTGSDRVHISLFLLIKVI
jgi:hypothetical protein